MYKWNGHWNSTMLLRAVKEYRWIDKRNQYWADDWLKAMVESYLDTRWYDKGYVRPSEWDEESLNQLIS